MQLHWHTEPFLLSSLLFFGWAYAVATGPLRFRFAPEQAFPIRASILFYIGLITVYIAVGSPLDAIAELFLFSAHMTQHMLLIYLAPTLLIFGMPPWLIDPLIGGIRAKRSWTASPILPVAVFYSLLPSRFGTFQRFMRQPWLISAFISSSISQCFHWAC